MPNGSAARSREPLTPSKIDSLLRSERPTDALREWSMDTVRTTIAARKVLVGSIIWEKALGRPDAPSLSDGFEIALWTQRSWHDLQTQRDASLKPSFFPVKWEAPDEGDSHRVNFMLSSDISGPHVLEVGFVSEIDWINVAPANEFRIRKLKPISKRIDKNPQELLFVEPFEVASIPRAPFAGDISGA